MSPEAAFDALRLIRSSNVGPVTYRQLMARFGSATAALAALPDLARRGGGRAMTIAKEDDTRGEVEAVARLGARHLFLGDPEYPRLLAEIDTAPPVMIVRGDLSLTAKRAVAIVGARNASAAAIRYARGLAHDLATQGLVVVSGLARGIDTAAHHGAMGADGGTTIGVIASGIDIAFPPENRNLQEDVATRHLLLAEQPPGREPLARHFPSRNRIIAGMSLATVVVEAAPRSGSLITARLAGEFGREVLAVPGSPLDPRAQGCNALIREGATLIQTADDVMEAIQPLGLRVAEPVGEWQGMAAPVDADDGARAAVTSLLGATAVPVDEVVRLSGRHPAEVATVLLELELAGRLTRHAGGKVNLD